MFEITMDMNVPKTPLFTPGAAERIVAEEQQRAMEASVLQVKGAILPFVPVNLGALRQGVQAMVSGTPANLSGKVFDPITYASAVEHGTRPHFPPLGPIELWVRRKLGIPEGRQSRSVAFLVARAISRRGTKAVQFFKRGWDSSEGQVRARFRDAQARIVARIVARLGGR
jgi:hypothetical protein